MKEPKMTDKNTGMSYEVLTKKIFQHILDQDSVHTIEAKHNVILQGKSVKHQIDVYWEFELGGGITYRTIVQCKDWASNPVKQEHLLTFKAILDDLPGQPRGIFVTRKGYQSGAKEFAEAHGIILYELNEPNWEGTITNIDMKMIFYVPKIQDFQFEQDMEWMTKQSTKIGSEQNEIHYTNFCRPSDQIEFFDDEKNAIGMQNIIDKWVAESACQEKSLQPVTHVFDRPTYMKTSLTEFPMVKINSVSAKISLRKSEHELAVSGPEIIGFILKNVLENKKIKVDKDGKPLK